MAAKNKVSEDAENLVVLAEIRKDIKRLEDVLRMYASQAKGAQEALELKSEKSEERLTKTLEDHEIRLRDNKDKITKFTGIAIGAYTALGVVFTLINIFVQARPQ
jgi:ElaB/YqjD/DUF883 family membrane-anchored ribosome-binding protein